MFAYFAVFHLIRILGRIVYTNMYLVRGHRHMYIQQYVYYSGQYRSHVTYHTLKV